jgi:hypothetical protein
MTRHQRFGGKMQLVPTEWKLHAVLEGVLRRERMTTVLAGSFPLCRNSAWTVCRLALLDMTIRNCHHDLLA